MRLEFEMRIPVSQWLIARGLSPVCEVASLNNCDLVGVRFSEKPLTLVEMVAVELKLLDVAAVIRQCKSHLLYSVSEVWAAMSPVTARKHQDRFASLGIGLLAVDEAGLAEIVPARRNEGCDLSRWAPAMRRRRKEYEWRMKHKNMLRYVKPPLGAAG